MDDVVHIMSQLLPFFTGHDEPVKYPSEGDLLGLYSTVGI